MDWTLINRIASQPDSQQLLIDSATFYWNRHPHCAILLVAVWASRIGMDPMTESTMMTGRMGGNYWMGWARCVPNPKREPRIPVAMNAIPVSGDSHGTMTNEHAGH
jgi:hypothetical protein